MQAANTRFEPFWWETAPLAGAGSEAAQNSIPPTCDVAIVGAGYTGLSAAHALAAAGRSVQVFDRQRPGEGASSRNGGIVSGNLRISLSRAIGKFGIDRAVALYQEGRDAREDLYAFLRDTGLDCDFKMSGRFTGALNVADYDAMAREGDLLRQHIGIDAYSISRADLHNEIGSQLYQGGLVRPDIGMFHPAKFHAGLLRLAIAAGAQVHGETPVHGIVRDAADFEVTTAKGRLRARDIIVATNGYTDGADPWLRRRLIPVGSRMIATEPLSENLMRHLLPKGRAMGEKRNLYRYYRPSPDGTRILLGAREPQFRQSEAKAMAHVRTALCEIFPELADVAITHTWAGNVAINLDQLPRLFVHEGMHYAVGYCGSGTVWARWLGKKAALKLLGKSDIPSVFEARPPMALPFYRGRPWFLPAAMAYYGAKDRLKTAWRS